MAIADVFDALTSDRVYRKAFPVDGGGADDARTARLATSTLCCSTTSFAGPGGLLTQLAGRVIETALGAELTEHLGYPPGWGGAGERRNGSGRRR